MNTPFDHDQPLDPYLQEKLDLLRDTPPRDPQAAARGRERFLAELDAASDVKTRPLNSRTPGWPRKNRSFEKGNLMNRPQRFAFTAALAAIVIAILLLSGAGATAYASQASLPGDALFPVKTSLEQTQARLTLNAYQRAQLHLRFAQRRVDEIARLMQAGRFEDVKAASAEFEYYVGQAMQSLQVVMAGDPVRARQLADQISAAMLAYVDALKAVWVQVPEDVRPSVLQAILAARDDSDDQGDHSEEIEFVGLVEAIGVDSWIIGGSVVAIQSGTEVKGDIQVGDLVKVHLLATADGSLIAREIELDHGDDSQGNDNDNQGGDDNGNDNSGDNGNDNGDDGNDNADDNGNDNGDEAGNDNGANDNGDDGGNDNGGNDNGDDDDNGNDNGDDGGNDNSDDDDNGNDNGDDDDNANDNGDDGGNDNGDDGGNDNDNGDDGGNDNDNGDDGGNDNGGDDDSGDDDGGDDGGGDDDGGDDGGGDDGGD